MGVDGRHYGKPMHELPSRLRSFRPVLPWKAGKEPDIGKLERAVKQAEKAFNKAADAFDDCEDQCDPNGAAELFDAWVEASPGRQDKQARKALLKEMDKVKQAKAQFARLEEAMNKAQSVYDRANSRLNDAECGQSKPGVAVYNRQWPDNTWNEATGEVENT